MKLETRYFTPELFAGAFCLPRFVHALIDGIPYGKRTRRR
jgi:hypothetical protein